MGFSDIIRGGVSIIDGLTVDMQVPVTFKAWIGQTGSGVDQFADPVTLRCFVDRSQKPLYTNAGKLIIVMATLTFTIVIPATTPNANQARVNPVDPRDIFILDDGFSGPIIKAGGFEDSGNPPAPFSNTVMLGSV